MALELTDCERQASEAVKAFWGSLAATRREQIESGHACQGERPGIEGAFGTQPPPFVGWLILVEDAPESRIQVSDKSPHFPIFEEFRDASYLNRYDILCQKLMREQLYTTAALVTAPRTAIHSGEYGEMSSMTSLKTFITALAGHVAAEAARLG